MATGGESPSPGWYPDPQVPGQLRWWDGASWTEHVSVPSAPVTVLGGLPPRQAVEAVVAARRPAHTALLYGGIALAVAAIANHVQARQLTTTVRRALDAARAGSQPPTVTPGGNAIAALLANLGSLAMLVVGVLFLVWVHRAVVAGRALGWTDRWTPGWAVGWWFVPVANFWMPYRVVRDTLPPGSPDRAVVRRWWWLWIGASLGQAAAGVISIFASGPGLALSAVVGTLFVAAALEARVVVDTVTDAQRRAVAV